MRYLIVLFTALMLSSCSMGNRIITERYLTSTGETDRIVTTEELSDDAFYYKRAAEVQIEESRSTCAPNCAPGELGNIEAFKTIRWITGNGFVKRGMNVVEMGESLGRTAINNSPLAFLAWKFGDATGGNSSSVKMDGDGNTYAPMSYQWTGNNGTRSSYSAPYSMGLE